VDSDWLSICVTQSAP